MAEFYDPTLYLSTPEHPNTMGMSVILRDEVDHDILSGVVDDLRRRFPYLYVRAVVEGDDLVPKANPLPMTVRGTWEPIDLNSKESNLHLGACKHEGRRLAFEISHSLTDGAGLLPYFKSALWLYVSRRYDVSLDREGFRLPGDAIPESEVGNPFAGLDIDGAEEPLYVKEHTTDFLRPSDGFAADSRVTYVRMPEAQVMRLCRDIDGSPNALLSVMLARAARRSDPESDKTISVAVAIDHKAMLGNHDNYRLFASVVELDFARDRALDDLARACTIARGQIIAQAQPENSLWALRQRKANAERLAQVPLDVKLEAIAKSMSAPRWSMSVSYVSSRSFGPLDPYVEEFYVLSEPGVTDVVCEVTCINHGFFLAIAQNFSSDGLVDALLEELSSVGIDCEVRGRGPLDLCGMAPYDVAG